MLSRVRIAGLQGEPGRKPGLYSTTEIHGIEPRADEEGCGRGRAVAGPADHHHSSVPGERCEPALKLSEGDMEGTSDVTGLPLVQFTDIKNHRTFMHENVRLPRPTSPRSPSSCFPCRQAIRPPDVQASLSGAQDLSVWEYTPLGIWL